MTATDIVDALEEVALLLELGGENHFKVRAYSNAARVVSYSPESLPDLVNKALAGEIKGIGPAIAEAVAELFHKGRYHYLEQLRDSFPKGVLEMLNIPGLGAKKVKVLYEELEIDSISKLETACRKNEISELKGFGLKTEQNILAGIQRIKSFSGQFLYSEAIPQAQALLDYLKQSKFCKEAFIAGSLRRGKEVVKDIDVLAVSTAPTKLMTHFINYPLADSVSSNGETKSSIILESGIAVDLRVVAKDEISSALLHFTGSKDHNTELRSIAQAQGYKLNEYGLHKGIKKVKTGSEEDIYKKLGLAFIPPELRESMGECAHAEKFSKAKKQFDDLLEEKDIKGILHAHCTYSDGKNSLEEMALATKELGYEYLGITDHSQSAAYAGGLKPAEILKQFKEIDKLNKKLAPFKIFKGIESDILGDGSLDYSEEILEQFDFVIASVHSRFKMTEEEMTARIITAIENPYTTILGHSSGRLLLRREPYKIDTQKILKAAAENNVVVEINANPQRLDLDWRYHKRAIELGVKLAICPDAHSIAGLLHVKFGIAVARKGWVTKENILNCLSLKDLEKFLDAKKTR
jgi:DNA polymerase (family 10)